MSGTTTEVLSGLRRRFGSFCLVAIVLCGILHVAYSDTKVCGNGINDALRMMCGPEGFNMYKTKRSYPLGEGALIDEEDDGGERFILDELEGIPFWTRMTGNSLVKLRRETPIKDGIFYECCRKPCTKRELMTFCKA